MTYTNKIAATVALCGVSLFAACSDDNSDKSSGGSVTVDVATAQAALTSLSSSVDTTVTGFAPTANGGAVTVACAAGGQADVTGKVNVTPVPLNVDVSLAIQYAACHANDGTIIAGDLEFSQTVVAGSQPLHVETIYTGNIQFSGKVQASCPVDLNVVVDQAGKAVSMNGTFCGQAASQLNLQITPRWGN